MVGDGNSTAEYARDVYSVSRLNREVRSVLEGSFPLLWVAGEISNLARPSSGHIYFSLKDEAAQVRCAMFRLRRQHLRFAPENGFQVVVRARISLYEGRGEFQLIIEHMEPAGEGALRQAFERLKQKLAAEGLFDSVHKQPLPDFPIHLGVITSPSGAAIKDVLSVLRRRYPLLPVVVYPVQVQGTEAPEQIVRMIQLANRRAECDVLLLTRGGGSLEDLMAFNDEAVARAVFHSRIPLVAGVGHEIDFTIADLVADHRAPTPSAAAEFIAPDRIALAARLAVITQRLLLSVRQRLQRLGQDLNGLVRRLRPLHPGNRLVQGSQRLDELEQRMVRMTATDLQQRRARLNTLRARLTAQTPAHRLLRLWQRARDLQHRSRLAIGARLERNKARLGLAVHGLQTVNPLATLARGYSIAFVLPERQLLQDARDVRPGTRIETRLSHGRLISTVDESIDEDSDG